MARVISSTEIGILLQTLNLGVNGSQHGFRSLFGMDSGGYFHTKWVDSGLEASANVYCQFFFNSRRYKTAGSCWRYLPTHMLRLEGPVSKLSSKVKAKIIGLVGRRRPVGKFSKK